MSLNHAVEVKTDGDFSLEIVWADWRPPGKNNNADNPLVLSKKDFKFVKFEKTDIEGGGQKASLYFQGIHQHLELRLSYELKAGASYIRRSLAVRDPVFNKHLLHLIKPLDAGFRRPGAVTIMNHGGFGQPVAFVFNGGGLFYGLEYPAGTNLIQDTGRKLFRLLSSRFVGKKLSQDWYESEAVVMGLSADSFVKNAFMQYISDIRVQPVRPYTLYNSWYDLRARTYTIGRYVKVLSDTDYMSQANVESLYQLIRQQFIDRYAVPLNAFVLDDGWDVYASNWKLRPVDFPHGLSPVVNMLDGSHTRLGMWFGPSGGYSDRMKRLNWYKENGYEVTGEEKEWGGAQLCLAGQRYSKVLRHRAMEFARQGVAYYKWDGVQFVCNEPDHGHPVGLYSQAAVLDSLLEMLADIRKLDPDVYHSVTSGTWLSLWWLMHANQIWMQGEDYGYATMPSINRRLAAITYRDSVLYDDLQRKNFWFPVSNMMMHGIIKGKLENLHVKEPLDGFADNAMMYFARGVSMYEFYTSPDIMNENEWRIIARSLQWAMSHFDLLMQTEMLGGDPARGEAYACIHYDMNKAVIVVRNPLHERQKMQLDFFTLMPEGDRASRLVLEKTYPYRYISPDLFAFKEGLNIVLDSYETSVYEVYPLESSREPLLAGVRFYSSRKGRGAMAYSI